MNKDKQSVPYCVHGDCKHPRIRKGEAVIITTFANYTGPNDTGDLVFVPWLGAVSHLRHRDGLDEAAIRRAIAAKRMPRTSHGGKPDGV